MSETIKYQVSGRVQRVFFRATTKQQADSLDLGGWVRNCEHGDVEGMASGSREQLERFIAWLGHGPAMAEVEELKIETCAYQSFDGFEIR